MNKIIYTLVIFSNAAMASKPANTVLEDAVNSTDFFKMILGLVVVLAVIFALAFAVKRLSGLNLGLAGNQYFKLIAAFSLGAKEKLVLVKVGEHHLLLGVSHNGISKLHDYGTEFSVEEQDSQAVNFSSLLHKFKTMNH